jgi:hypothetical protein
MVVHSISIPLPTGDMALRYRQHRSEEPLLFSDALRHEVERLFPEAMVDVHCGYSEPEVAADSVQESVKTYNAVHVAYNRVIDQAAW